MGRTSKAKATTILWTPDQALSAAHAIRAVSIGASLTDPKTEALLIESATQINMRLVSESIAVGRFWQGYLERVARSEAIVEAASGALLGAGCSVLQVDQTAGAVSKLLAEAADLFARQFPRLGAQLELRGQPLRQQWDSYGNGMTRLIKQSLWDLQMQPSVSGSGMTQPWWPDRLRCALIQPLRGGDGGWDSASDRVWIEAMLTDAEPTVPEVMRMAWLMTRLAIDKGYAVLPADESVPTPSSPTTSQANPQSPLQESAAASPPTTATSPRVIACAAIALVLWAGQQVQIVRDPLPVETAMRLWNIGSPEIADSVSQWWSSIGSDPARWASRINDLRLA